MRNPFYQQPEIMERVVQEWNTQQKLLLFDFLDAGVYEQLRKAVAVLQFSQDGNPLTHSYAMATASSAITKLLVTSEMRLFLAKVLQRPVTRIDVGIQRFTWKDYTLLHDAMTEKQGVDVFLDLTEEWDEKAGGHIMYVDGSGEFLSTPIAHNLLLMVARDEKTQRYVQYCNHYAKGKQRVLVRMRVD